MKQVGSKKKLMAIATFLVITLIGGSLAYWSQELSVENQFNTGKYGSELIEDITQCDDGDWEPGGTVNKKVKVSNTGNYDIIVRVKLDEEWVRNNGVIKSINFNDLASVNHSSNSGYAIYDIYQEDPSDGYIANDNSVVWKNFATSSNWVRGSDGWYYYKGNVYPSTSTDLLLNSLTLDKNTDMGYYATNYLCSTDGSTWYSYDPNNGTPKYLDGSGNPVAKDDPGAAPVTNLKTENVLDQNRPGYSSADYRLTVTAQTIQANREAIATEWFNGSTSTLDSMISEIGASWVF